MKQKKINMKPIIRTLLTITVNLVLFQVNAQILGSLNFNGNDNYVEVINSPINEIGDGNFTFEVWIKGEESEQNNHPMIFSNRGSSGSGNGMLFFIHDLWGGSQSKMLSIQIDGSNHLFVDNGSFNGSLLDNQCHHVAISRDGNTLSFYADGILIGSKSPSSLGSISSGEPLWIGKDETTNNTFNGIISQCRIWNFARTQGEINASKDLSLQGNEAGLLAYWEMDNENGQVVSDKTGQFNGVLGSSDQMDDQDPLWSEEGCVDGSTVSTGSGIEPFFKVAPNPTSGFLKIECQGIEGIQVYIADQTGKLLLSKTVNAPAIDVDISHYPQGIYFLSAVYNDQTVNRKIIRL